MGEEAIAGLRRRMWVKIRGLNAEFRWVSRELVGVGVEIYQP
jgi:hypothetical protein